MGKLSNYDDIVNNKFGRLLVLKQSHKDERNRMFYVCICDCGIEKIIQRSLIISGNTKSCGCLSKERKAATKLPNNKAEINSIILGYKRQKLGYNITYSDFAKLISLPCFYCGIENSNLKKTKNCPEGFAYNGLDRIDSNLGYTIENVVPCCFKCNYAKRNYTKEEFLDWVIKVYNHINQWG